MGRQRSFQKSNQRTINEETLRKYAATKLFKDLVNSPSHYTDHPSGVECIIIAEHFNFCLGNAIKYIWRSGEKDGSSELQDLKKARWYIDREIKRLTKNGYE